MTWERAGRLAWIAPLLAAACSALIVVLVPEADSDGIEALFGLTFVAYATVGALIVRRHPRHPVGWLFCGVGALTAAQEVLYSYGSRPEEPGAAAAAWVAAWSSEPSTVALVFLLLLFPTGHFASRAWRVAGVAALGSALVWALALAFDPGPLRNSESVANPVGIESGAAVLDAIADLGILNLLLFLILAVAGAIARYRRARGEERQQTKWLALAAGALLAAVLAELGLLLAVDTDEGIWDFLSALIVLAGLAAFPVSAGLGILRHRLYDIDLVVNRALVYGTLTATLAAGYLGCVLLAQWVIGAESDLAVAGSTLAVAALFRPARTRIQALVDRRFYRRRYDAALTLEGFGSRLREELDLDALGADLRRVVADTMQPAHVSLWLRGARR